MDRKHEYRVAVGCGIGITVVLFVLPLLWPEMPTYITYPGLLMGIALFCWGAWPPVADRYKVIFRKKCSIQSEDITSLPESMMPIPHPTATATDENIIKKPQTLRHYFDTDFPNCLKVSNQCSLASANNENKIDIPWQVCNDFGAGTKFLSFYIPRFPDAYGVCVALSDFTKQTMETVNTGLEIQSKSPGDSSHVDMKDLQFSGRVYLYHENLFSLAELGALETIYKNKNLFPQFRGSEYSTSRWFQERMAAKN